MSLSKLARPGFPIGLCAVLFALSACDRAPAPEAATPAPEAAPAPAQTAAPAPAAAAAPVATPAPMSAAAAALIGQIVPPYPDGLAEIGGGCVPGAEGYEHVCDFGIAMLGSGAADGQAAMARYVIASRKAEPAGKDPRWEVLDAVDAPAMQPGDQLQLGGCKFDGKDAAGVIAAVRYGAQEQSSDLRWVRRFDTDAGKLVEVEASRVSCANPAAGV